MLMPSHQGVHFLVEGHGVIRWLALSSAAMRILHRMSETIIIR